MTKVELVELISNRAGITKKQAAASLQSFVAAIHSSLTGNEGMIRIANLGTFKVVDRKARNGVNPQTGARMTIPASRVPSFSSAKALRAVVVGDSTDTADVCADPQSTREKLICRICGLPGIGNLPFCEAHSHHHD